MELVYRRTIQTEYFAEIVGLPGCRVEVALFRIPGCQHHIELFQYLLPAGKKVETRPCDPGSTHLSLLVDDLPALYERLSATGVSFVSPPVLIASGPNQGGYGIYCRDPNGILLELFQQPKDAPVARA